MPNNIAIVPSQKVLDVTPTRAMQFLRGITFRPVRAAMQRKGYKKSDHTEGWKLLQQACGFVDGDNDAIVLTDEVAAAVAEIDAWDEAGYRRARAALTRLHPEQAAFVFNGLQASQGMQAVMGMITFLDRLKALEESPERKDTRKADRAALETLEKRGIGVDERARLAALVKTVKNSPDLDLDSETDVAKAEEERQRALIALRAWYEDWTDTARSAITRRDYLIRLGLAKRKANGKIEDVSEDDTDGGDDDAAPQPKKPQPEPVA